MNRRRQLAVAASCADVDGLLGTLRDNLGKADAFISSAEELIERSWGGGEDPADSAMRRRNHVEHLVESAKLAVRVAASAGEALDELRTRRQGP